MNFLERIRPNVRYILSLDESPHKIAVSFAIGVFVGLSAFIGLHTVISLTLAWMLRLNRLAILTGTFLNNPWSMIPIYTFSTWIGSKVLGMDSFIPDVNWSNITVGSLAGDLGHMVLPFIVGSTIVGFISSVAGYVIIRKSVTSVREEVRKWDSQENSRGSGP